MSEGSNIVQHETVQAALRKDFLRWQCEVRKLAARYSNAKPQDAMRPFVTLPEDEEARVRIVTVLVEQAPETTTKELRHIVRRSVDPVERLNSALNKLSGTYFEEPESFSDKPAALFGGDARLAEALLRAGHCALDFQQGGQQYQFPCVVEEMSSEHPVYQATYWHNHLFNPAMPPGVRVLRFHPQWANAWAEPMPE